MNAAFRLVACHGSRRHCFATQNWQPRCSFAAGTLSASLPAPPRFTGAGTAYRDVRPQPGGTSWTPRAPSTRGPPFGWASGGDHLARAQRFSSQSAQPSGSKLSITPKLASRLDALTQRHTALCEALIDPAITPAKLAAQSKELAGLSAVVQQWDDLTACRAQIKEAQELQSDPAFQSLAQEELAELLPAAAEREEQLVLALLPRDDADDRNVVLEVRPAAGGDEASLFAEELLSMYQQHAKLHGWQCTLLQVDRTEAGIRLGAASIAGQGVFAALKFENGVHRVQRIPSTEAAGRIHTSTVTVVVMPEADEVEVDLRMADLRVETMRASGAGGQHVNTTDSAVRLTHLPTGMQVYNASERSQHQNKARALQVMRARLFDAQREAAAAAASHSRMSAIGSGDRSERIRTYNFPQGRVTDHRVGLSVAGIDQVMLGLKLSQFTDALRVHEQTERMADFGGD